MYIKVDNNNTKQFDNAIKTGNIIVLYHAHWCPHCVTMKPVWDDFVSQCQKKNLDVNIAEVESEHIQNVKTANDVEGFPTVKYYKSATSNTHYEGERSVSAFLKFAEDQAKKFKKNKKSGYESDNESESHVNSTNEKPKRTKKYRKRGRKTKRNNTKRKGK